MTWIRVVVATLLIAGALSAPPADARAGPIIAGEWDLVLTRSNMQPNAARARLVLSDDKTPGGTLQFDIVLGRREVPLTDVSATTDSVAFRAAAMDQDLRFEGTLAGGSLAGTCEWKGLGTYSWSATAPRLRFEPGLAPDKDLPQADAEKLGIDGAALDDLLRTCARDDTDAVLVLKDGKLVAERTFGAEASKIHVMSITKAFTALAITKLLEEKKIASLDAPVSKWIPEWNMGAKAKVTLRHLVSHTSGLDHAPTAAKLNAARDKVAYAAALEVSGEPGARWSYNNEAVALLSAVVAKASGKPLDEYVKDRVLEPCGVKDLHWDRDEAGNAFAYANLALSGRDLARVGRMVAADGKNAAGKPVLSAASVALLSQPPVPARRDQGLLWLVKVNESSKAGPSLHHTGSLGQWLVVHPAAKLVAVRLRRGQVTGEHDPREFECGTFGAKVAALVK